MTITIELTPEEDARLRSKAEERGTDVSTLAHDLLSLTLTPKLTNGREIYAYWEAHDLLGKLFTDRTEDAPELARKLREEANRDTRL